MLFLLLEALFLQQVIKYSSFQSSPIMSLNIDISSQLLSFKKHLQIPNNTRILFSGPFGSGKTYFMERFFEQNETDYIKIKINPIHYSVASNEDIFELIKYDILFELLGRQEIETIEEENPLSLVLASFIQSKSDGMATLGASAIGLADTTLAKIGLGVLTVSKLMAKFEKYKKAITKNHTVLITDFLKTVTQKPGIREEDLITLMLCELMAFIKDVSSKKIVLVIDDLDRIDPEHIFRIFNVFAAHFDIVTENNKFDFDHVVLICDEKNIRNIFKARYGANVDYNGYIDKFFSKEVHEFDNSNGLQLILNEILLEYPKVKKDFTTRTYIYDIVRIVLQSSIKAGLLQTRGLVKLNKKDLSIFQGYFQYSQYDGCYLLIGEAFEILSTILGGSSILEGFLNQLASSYDEVAFSDKEDSNFIRKLEGIVPLLTYRKHKFQTSFFSEELHFKDSFGLEISFKLKEFNSGKSSPIIHGTDLRLHSEIGIREFFILLEKSFMVWRA